jgi:hypothetical protein
MLVFLDIGVPILCFVFSFFFFEYYKKVVGGLIMGIKPLTKSRVIMNATNPMQIMPKTQTLIMAHISLRVGYLASLNTRLDLLMKLITPKFLGLQFCSIYSDGLWFDWL